MENQNGRAEFQDKRGKRETVATCTGDKQFHSSPPSCRKNHSFNDVMLLTATQRSLDDVADDDEHDRRRSAVHAAGAVPGQAGGRQESH